MERRINVEEAVIKTATVSIKQLTINARKMTLSVFRQIMKESIIDTDTHDLLGIPWGQVNYFWGDEQGDIHVLWQIGNELRRCVLMAPRDVFSYFYFRSYDHSTSGFWNEYKSPTELIKGRAIDLCDFLNHNKFGSEGYGVGTGERYRKWVSRLDADDVAICDELLGRLEDAVDSYSEKYKTLSLIDHLFIAV